MKFFGFIFFTLFCVVDFAAAACTSLPASTAHLVDKGNGTVIDGSTKLMWKQCLEGLSETGCSTGTAASTFDWAGALVRPATVNSVGFATYTDWRLPNIKELQSIVEEQCYSPAINATVFPNVLATSQVWSSSPYSESVLSGGVTYWKSWAVNFATGVVTLPLSRSTNTLHVRLVRDCTGAECD